MTCLQALMISAGLLGSTVPGPSPDQLAAYYRCDAAAMTGRLTPAGRAACAMVYMQVKLAFVGTSPDAFAALPPERRAALNDRAYAVFKAWEAANPGLVASLRSLD